MFPKSTIRISRCCLWNDRPNFRDRVQENGGASRSWSADSSPVPVIRTKKFLVSSLHVDAIVRHTHCGFTAARAVAEKKPDVHLVASPDYDEEVCNRLMSVMGYNAKTYKANQKDKEESDAKFEEGLRKLAEREQWPNAEQEK